MAIPTGKEQGAGYAEGATVDTSYGNVRVGEDGATEGRVADGRSWGGWKSRVVRGEDGQLYTDRSVSGQQADVDRYRGMAEAAANRDAYQNNYGAANAWNAGGAQMRGAQGDAAAMYRDAAYGRNSQAQALGQQMLTQGAQMQQAAALSTRGGAMAQAAAMRRQQAGQGAYMQQGNAQLQALQAQEMAAGRAGYMSALGAQRAGDATSQALNQQQAIAQMQNEMQQRGLNQEGQLGYEGMAYDVDAAALEGQLKHYQNEAGVYSNQLVIDQAQRDRDARMMGAGMGAVGAAAGAAFSDPRLRSDVRSKGQIQPLGLAGASMVRGRY